MINSETEFKSEMLRLIRQTEGKVEDIRYQHPGDIANYDATEENQILEQDKNALLPLMQHNPLWAFEVLFDFLNAKGYEHFYPIQIVEHFVTYSLPIPHEIVAFLKDRLFENQFRFLKQASLAMLGVILRYQSDENLQNELLGFLLHEDYTFRLISIRIFEYLRDERAIPFLRLLLEDTDVRVRRKSKMSLALFNTPASRMALQEWHKQNPKD